MTEQEEIINTIKVLRKEVEVLTTRLKSAGTGYLHTAIDVINGRIDELIEEVTAPFWKDENGDIGRLPGQTRESHLRSVEGAFEQEDVYDGYKEHTDELGRKAVQHNIFSGKGHWAGDDDVEHTKEYYDTQRNKPMEGQDFHLEPLPINTFK
tara:strand:+ start:62 stop:517 length:456 start_codon:yes stop_codon:yes gene_type:complete